MNRTNSEASGPLTVSELQDMLDRSPFLSFLGLKVVEADPVAGQVTMTIVTVTLKQFSSSVKEPEAGHH